jgi:hypothetical protein
LNDKLLFPSLEIVTEVQCERAALIKKGADLEDMDEYAGVVAVYGIKR